MDWLTDNKLPMADSVAPILVWLKSIPGLAQIGEFLAFVIGALELGLQSLNPLVVVAVFAAITFGLQRRWVPIVIVVLGLGLVINQGYWTQMTETLALVLISVAVTMGVGVPLGIYLAHRQRRRNRVRPVLSVVQTVPALVFLLAMLLLFGAGRVPSLFAVIVFALPSAIELTRRGVALAPDNLVDTADAFGASPGQLFWKVEWPSARPMILSALHLVTLRSFSIATLTVLVGGAGLGVPALTALASEDVVLGVEALVVIAAVGLVLDRMLRVRA